MIINCTIIFSVQKTQNHMDIGFNVSSSKETKHDPAFSCGFTRIEKLNGLKLNTHFTLTRPRLVKMQFKFNEVSF